MTHRLAGTTATTLRMAHQVVRAVVAEAAHHPMVALRPMVALHPMVALRLPMAVAVHPVVIE